LSLAAVLAQYGNATIGGSEGRTLGMTCTPDFAQDRIARLQRRIAVGSYRFDPVVLAQTLVALDSNDCGLSLGVCHDNIVRNSAETMVGATLETLPVQSAMVLQLHYVEWLPAWEIGRILGLSTAAAETVRRTALRRLGAMLGN
jgi:DNA-directed RNA polymerase specialized sigma24 family protein